MSDTLPRDDVRTKRVVFHNLHDAGCFVIPNPWDRGSARALASLGYAALATTSSGFAWSIGSADNTISLEQALEHLAEISSAVSIPVNADFEGGFAVEPADVARNVERATSTGIAGLSIEDSTGNASAPLYDFALAVERVRAARHAIDSANASANANDRTRVLLTGRSEGFIAGRPDIAETIKRLVAYAEAGADCLYAPGIRTAEHITAVVNAVAPKPVNVLVSSNFTTVAALAELGVRRISVGGALARTAWKGFLSAAQEIASNGTFGSFAKASTSQEIEGTFTRDSR